MTPQVLIKELPVGTPFMHVSHLGTAKPQPEQVFRLVELRKKTAIVESGVGVRTSMSLKTPVIRLPDAATPARRADEDAEKAAG